MTISFELGRVLATPRALALVAEDHEQIAALVTRHAAGDWGTVHPEDQGLNEQALATGGRIFSVYELGSGDRLWIITEAIGPDGHRASTVVLLPNEY